MPIRKNGQLSLKESRFVSYYAASGNASRSAILAGYKQRQSGYENLTKPHIIGALEGSLAQAGITFRKVAFAIRAGLDAVIISKNGKTVPDYATRCRHIDICLRLLEPDLFGPKRRKK